MAAFDYTALDGRGKACKGSLEGDSARLVRQQLRDQGLSPLTVEAAAAAGRQSGSDKTALTKSRQTIGSLDLAVLTRQLATLIQAGMPVEEALRAMSKQVEKPKIRSMLLAVRSRVTEGHTLAASLNLFPRAFPDIYCATVSAGEHAGHLDLVLDQLADYTEDTHDTAKKVWRYKKT